jgi:erythromycin esterase
MIMRIAARFASLALLSIAAVVAGCHTAPPPPPPVIVPLTDSAAAALRWVQSHANPLAIADSTPSAAERTQLASFAGDARIIGVSELTEGTHEFPAVVGRILFGLAESANVRALAVQAPMAEAMELDRFVRTGTGDPRRLLRTLGSWRWETPEMLSLVEAIRTWNRTHDANRQIGFYGFEIPTATHAVDVINALPDSIAGTPLKSWFRREYPCVLRDEAARFGNGGRASDSTFWKGCGVVVNAAVDSIVALRARLSPSRSAQVAFVEQMVRLVQHHVVTGLKYLPRQEVVADHVMYIADLIGPNAKLLTWGGDVEVGRLTLDKTTVQSGDVLGKRLGDKYRTLAFLFGDGTVRARTGAFGRNGQPADLTNVMVLPPTAGMYEDVLSRAPLAAYWLDMRALPSDNGGAWLRGPRSGRLITELYVASSAQSFLTPLEFPKFFDGIMFIKHVSPPR